MISHISLYCGEIDYVTASGFTSDENSWVRRAEGFDPSQFMAFVHPLDKFFGEQLPQRCLLRAPSYSGIQVKNYGSVVDGEKIHSSA